MLTKLEALLEERVRPSLRAHGGDAEIISYEDGVLRLRLLGQCASCPAAQLTNETLIETQLCEAVPELTRVLLQQEVSPDLLDQARAFLKKS